MFLFNNKKVNEQKRITFCESVKKLNPKIRFKNEDDNYCLYTDLNNYDLCEINLPNESHYSTDPFETSCFGYISIDYNNLRFRIFSKKYTRSNNQF